jgi:glycosyltransferase involved in cell wall biosynthesis
MELSVALKNQPLSRIETLNFAKKFIEINRYSFAQKIIINYLKNNKYDDELIDILADIYYFNGDYRKALKLYSTIKKKSINDEIKNDIIQKIISTHERIISSKKQTKIAIIVNEDEDDFLDPIIKGINTDNWVKKIVIPKNYARFQNFLSKALKNQIINKKLYKLILKITNKNLRKALKWADIVWVEWATDNAIAASYLKPSTTKLFIRLHRYEAFDFYPLLVEWERVDNLVLVNEYILNILTERNLNIDNKKIKIIANGIDIDKFSYHIHSHGFNIAWVSHITPMKNLHVALEILRKLQEKDEKYMLHIAGNFTDLVYEKYIKQYISKMHLEKNVIFYDWVNDINEWLNDKDYLLSTSVCEGHPYNVIEAMTKGIKPIINNFYGAEFAFDNSLLFNNIDEAIEMITSDSYDSLFYHNYIIDKQWTEKDQIEKFKILIREMIK